MKTRVYKDHDPWCVIVWTWNSFLFFKWGFKRTKAVKMPRYINCRCSTVKAEKE
jgi:hypothetical protein